MGSYLLLWIISAAQKVSRAHLSGIMAAGQTRTTPPLANTAVVLLLLCCGGLVTCCGGGGVGEHVPFMPALPHHLGLGITALGGYKLQLCLRW